MTETANGHGGSKAPRCPQCGCQHSEIQDRNTWWGHDVDRRKCRNCANVWWVPCPAEPDPDALLIYRPIRCPKCGGGRTYVHTTRRPIRYHRCEDCKHRFKSVEPKPRS